MSKIANEPKIKNKVITAVREQLEHRALWLYLLLDEAEKSGMDSDAFARKAVSRCGHIQGRRLVKKGWTQKSEGAEKDAVYQTGSVGV